MKTKTTKYFLPLALGIALSIITLTGLFSLNGCNIENCTDADYPLYCSSADKCCGAGYPYTDGHGSCYTSLSSCTATGYSCEHCWEE